MYGYRARIGYTSPPTLTEVFPYEFYKMAPPGVTLIVTTLAIMQINKSELDQSREFSLRIAREMARAGASTVVLGGVPINLSLGFEEAENMLRATGREVGVPVTNSLTAQMHGLRDVGAKRVGVIHPFDESHSGMYDYLQRFGFEVVGIKSAGYPVLDLGRIPIEEPVGLARELVKEHPELDTLYFPCPHFAIVEKIEEMEQALSRNVVTSGQAIMWEALRLSDIGDSIQGYGKLLRKH